MALGLGLGLGFGLGLGAWRVRPWANDSCLLRRPSTDPVVTMGMVAVQASLRDTTLPRCDTGLTNSCHQG